MNESESTLYEAHYTLKAQNPEDAAAKTGAIIGMIEKEHGIVAAQTPPSLKTLAYPIKKEREAYVGWIRFMLKPEAAAAFEKQLRTDASVLRSAVMRAQKDDMAIDSRRRKHVTAPAIAPETQVKNNEEIDKRLQEILGV